MNAQNFLTIGNWHVVFSVLFLMMYNLLHDLQYVWMCIISLWYASLPLFFFFCFFACEFTSMPHKCCAFTLIHKNNRKKKANVLPQLSVSCFFQFVDHLSMKIPLCIYTSINSFYFSSTSDKFTNGQIKDANRSINVLDCMRVTWRCAL